jgi:phospholipid/cholesterol/gamma-HCH transport system permease protein
MAEQEDKNKMAAMQWIKQTSKDGQTVIELHGDWVVANGRDLDIAVVGFMFQTSAQTDNKLVLDLKHVGLFDTSGAWFIEKLRLGLADKGKNFTHIRATELQSPLVDLVHDLDREAGALPEEVARTGFIAMLERLGRGTVMALVEVRDLLNFLGLTTFAAWRVLKDPINRFRPIAIVTQMEQTGLNALPIVGLLSFLIGVVLAYLMSDQLRQFGAEVFTVNLIGLSILREIGVLITAILIAGRSGSAFTAQIGTMKVNEEIDAMRVIGLDPVEILVLPRVLALIITLTLLTFFSDVMGVLGGAVMSVLVLDLTPVQFF